MRWIALLVVLSLAGCHAPSTISTLTVSYSEGPVSASYRLATVER